MTNLSPNFTLEEMIFSQHATRKDMDNTPNARQKTNLERLTNAYMEPLRDILGDRPIIVSSGFRSYNLNRAIGGSKRSAHLDGRAVDFTVKGVPTLDVMETIVTSGFYKNCDQVIYEFGRWIHLGIAEMGKEPRKQLLMIAPGGKIYANYNREMAATF